MLARATQEITIGGILMALTATRARRAFILTGALAAMMMLLPGTSFGARFGAKLAASNGTVFQPSNSTPAHDCGNATQSCTRVSVKSATGSPGGNITSPITGTLTRIRLVAGAPGSFRFQLARTQNVTGNHGDAKIVRSFGTTLIHYQGNGFNANNQIEVFKFNMHVKHGDNIAIKAKKTSALRCDSNGTRQLLFQPALALGGAFQTSTDNDGCTLMIQAVVHA
jgi:hypothetical protein